MTEMHIVDLFGPICVAYDDGTKLHDLIRPVLERGETVCLDFSGVTSLRWPFLGQAIGALYEFFPKEDLEKRLHWKGLDDRHEDVMRDLQEKAILFHSTSPEIQEKLLGIDSRAVEWYD